MGLFSLAAASALDSAQEPQRAGMRPFSSSSAGVLAFQKGLVQRLAFSELAERETTEIVPLASNSSLAKGALFGAMSVAASKSRSSAIYFSFFIVSHLQVS